jgi:hypothetical protein
LRVVEEFAERLVAAFVAALELRHHHLDRRQRVLDLVRELAGDDLPGSDLFEHDVFLAVLLHLVGHRVELRRDQAQLARPRTAKPERRIRLGPLQESGEDGLDAVFELAREGEEDAAQK